MDEWQSHEVCVNLIRTSKRQVVSVACSVSLVAVLRSTDVASVHLLWRVFFSRVRAGVLGNK